MEISILLRIFAALRQQVGPVGLWFVVGHPDYQDERTSATGETADMDLAVLTGGGAPPLVTLAGAAPTVPARDVVLLGHRTNGLDVGAAAELNRLLEDLRRIDAPTLVGDPGAAGKQAAAWLANAGHGAWLHLDLDVLDPALLPAVTYPQPGGPDWDQLACTLIPLARSSQLLGINIAGFRPDLDSTNRFALRIVDLLH